MTQTTYSSTKMMLITGSVIALAAFAMATPASAFYYYHSSDDTDVRSSNYASVENDVVVVSKTGSNGVTGGNTGRTGNGGYAHGRTATGGDGGDSGDSTNLGTILTGNSTAIGTVNNDVNRNNTVVTEGCDCDGSNGDVDVRSRNNGYVGNWLSVDSNTGDNGVVGGDSGAAGHGGDAISNTRSHYWKYFKANKGSAEGGDAGNSGDSSNDGLIQTGESVADGLVVNVVNRNVTRVNR